MLLQCSQSLSSLNAFILQGKKRLRLWMTILRRGVLRGQVVDGTVGNSGGIHDIIILVVLGVSVYIAVSVSQLAGELL